MAPFVALLMMLAASAPADQPPPPAPDRESGSEALGAADTQKALATFQPLAKHGHAEAQYQLGHIYGEGNGVPQDLDEAVKWFREAAEQGHTGAQLTLGVMYSEGRDVPQSATEAVIWLRMAAEGATLQAESEPYSITIRSGRTAKHGKQRAEQLRKSAKMGHAAAQHDLGLMYFEGTGVSQDHAQALKWWQQAAASGHTKAQYNLGVMHLRGHGVPQDPAEAVKLFREAAEQGFAEARVALGILYSEGRGVPQNAAEAVEWFRKAVELRLFESGKAALAAAEFEKAFAALHPLAKQGHAEAQYRLGTMHVEGYGVEQDLAEAVKLFREAAKQGHREARSQLSLGVMYSEGRGVPRDAAEAVRWLRKAVGAETALSSELEPDSTTYSSRRSPEQAKQRKKYLLKAAKKGDTAAQHDLGLMYVRGEGVAQDHAQALTLWQEAAASGHARSQYNLGVMHLRGHGVPQDRAEAAKWFREAAEQGLAKAQVTLGVMCSEGRGVPQDDAEAAKWLRKAAEQSQTGLAFVVGGNIEAPVEVYRVEPQYTEIAKAIRKEGIVIVQAVVSKQGLVREVKVLKGLGFGLDESAAGAVKQWRFKPGTLDGKPVDVIFTLTVRFQITT